MSIKNFGTRVILGSKSASKYMCEVVHYACQARLGAHTLYVFLLASRYLRVMFNGVVSFLT